MEFFITSTGIPVHINESKKDGPAILLLHGYLETMYIWEEFITMFPSCYRIISIDLPGHGLSGIPSDIFSPDFSNSFLLGILNKLSVDKCIVISHSCGFFIASSFAKSYPQRVDSIFNICSSFLPSQDELSFIRTIKLSSNEGSLLKVASQYIPRMYYNLNLRACDSKIEETIEICETHDPLALSVFYRDIESFFISDAEALIPSVPVYSICGQFELFPSNISNSLIIPNSGSNVFIECPDDVIKFISRNLDK